jgi:hypothetical protein
MLLNCKGLLRRAITHYDPVAFSAEFVKLTKGEQVLILTETWLTEDENLPTLNGFHGFHFPRPTHSRSRAPRGGVAIYVAEALHPYTSRVSFGEHDRNRVSWLRIDEEAGLGGNVLISGCYIEPGAPESAYFNYAEDVIAALAEDNPFMIAAGDFNAHTGAECGRWSQDADRAVDSQGQAMIHWMTAAGAHIANGRAPGASSGNYTFINSRGHQSVTDYVLLCPRLLPLASLSVERPDSFPAFATEDLDHCILRLSLRDFGLPSAPSQQFTPTQPTAMMPPMAKLILPDEHREAYVVAMAQRAEQLATAQAALEAAEDDDPNAATVFLTTLTTLITEAALEAGAKQVPVKCSRRMDSRQQIRQRVLKNPDYRKLRRLRNKARKRGNFPAAALYGRHLSAQKRSLVHTIRREMQQELLKLWKRAPSAAWAMLREFGDTGAHSAADKLAYCMQLLGGDDDATPVEPFELPDELCADGATLATPITSYDVERAIAAQKRGKATAGILNLDLIWPVCPHLAGPLASLFNVIARQGKMPTDMALGIITMVLKPKAQSTALRDHRTITV